MTDCGCDKAKAELEEYLHRELSDENFKDITEHLAHCESCTSEHLIGLTLTNKVRSACQEKAPEALRSAVLGRLSELKA
ncbi:MAG TPA: zf-HC2 domain-containing protein [Glaciihabitans sp.]|jgi:anti-sigma factor (TIGR02949 family)|nr:zf-HC2 domain-containing protein [Glaciihabitans sp.]